MGRNRDAVAIGEPTRKAFDLGGSYLARIAQVMEPNEGADPVDVGALGAQAVVRVAQALSNPVDHARRVPRRQYGAGVRGR